MPTCWNRAKAKAGATQADGTIFCLSAMLDVPQPSSSLDIRSTPGGAVRAAQQPAAVWRRRPHPWLSIYQVYRSLRGVGAGCQPQAVGAPVWEGVERCGQAPKAQTRSAPAVPGVPRQRWVAAPPGQRSPGCGEYLRPFPLNCKICLL
jgi:hypothetical protein